MADFKITEDFTKNRFQYAQRFSNLRPFTIACSNNNGKMALSVRNVAIPIINIISFKGGYVTSSLQGSKAARSEIKRFHGCLNQSNLVPDQCYRMSNMHYSMVSYTNQIIALFLSKNYDGIPVFIMRVLKAIEQTPVQPNTEPYRNVVQDYLCQMSHFFHRR